MGEDSEVLQMNMDLRYGGIIITLTLRHKNLWVSGGSGNSPSV